MIAIHPVQRRLMEITLKARKLKGYGNLPLSEQKELEQCLIANADIIAQLDSLKRLSYLAYEMGDVDWQHEVAGKLEQLEAKFETAGVDHAY